MDIKSSSAWSLIHGSVQAFGELRDGEAVSLLVRVATDNPHHIREFALDALAQIGTDEAADAIINFSNTIDFSKASDHSVIQFMIAHGSLRTVNQAIEIARRQADGPKWLLKQIRHVFMMRGWTVGEYYTHVQDAGLIEYLFSAEGNMNAEERRDLIKSFEQIDSDNVRRMLWVFAKRVGTDEDVKVVILKNHEGHMLSSEAFGELVNRADQQTLPKVISSALDCKQMVFSHQIEGLSKYPSAWIVSEVRTRLKNSSQSVKHIVRLISILGTYGASADAQAVSSYLNYDGESVRNICDETTRLLLDFLRVAEAWRESWLSE
jgi:hypothetical protein